MCVDLLFVCHDALQQFPVDGRVVGRLLQDSLEEGGDVVLAGRRAVPQDEGQDVVAQHVHRLVAQRHRQEVHQRGCLQSVNCSR